MRRGRPHQGPTCRRVAAPAAGAACGAAARRLRRSPCRRPAHGAGRHAQRARGGTARRRVHHHRPAAACRPSRLAPWRGSGTFTRDAARGGRRRRPAPRRGGAEGQVPAAGQWGGDVHRRPACGGGCPVRRVCDVDRGPGCRGGSKCEPGMHVDALCMLHISCIYLYCYSVFQACV